jgi:hypothetical protein
MICRSTPGRSGQAQVMTTPDEDTSGVSTALDRGRGLTIVAFGGLTTEGEKPRFEFFRFLSDFDVDRVFLRDHEQAWYQLGVRDVGDDADAVAAYLRDLLGTRASQAVFTGGSAGGYAAMLFGSMLGVAEVHAFAPQSFVSPWLRRLHRDHRWAKQVRRMHELGRTRRTYYDVRPSLRGAARTARVAPVPIHVHIGHLPLDRTHAHRLRRVRGVEIHEYDQVVDHAVARHLNEAGRLHDIFSGALRNAERARPA